VDVEGEAMEMFLMGLCVSMIGVAVSIIAFGAATRDERGRTEAKPAKTLPQAAPQFFVDQTVTPQARVALDALLSQVEHHVRLEQAAAESFVELPTPESLHSRTRSPLVH